MVLTLISSIVMLLLWMEPMTYMVCFLFIYFYSISIFACMIVYNGQSGNIENADIPLPFTFFEGGGAVTLRLIWIDSSKFDFPGTLSLEELVYQGNLETNVSANIDLVNPLRTDVTATQEVTGKGIHFLEMIKSPFEFR